MKQEPTPKDQELELLSRTCALFVKEFTSEQITSKEKQTSY